MDCIFCKIIAGDIPASKVYENDTILAFDDIDPKAPAHVLVVPKVHIADIENLTDDNKKVMGDLFMAVQEVARLKGITQKGYRVIINNGRAGGQEVFHMHIHVMGGRDSMGPMLAR